MSIKQKFKVNVLMCEALGITPLVRVSVQGSIGHNALNNVTLRVSDFRNTNILLFERHSRPPRSSLRPDR